MAFKKNGMVVLKKMKNNQGKHVGEENFRPKNEKN